MKIVKKWEIPIVVKKVLLSSLLPVALSYLLLLLGENTIGKLIGIEKDFYLKYYYGWANFVGTNKSIIPDSLVIIDIQNYRSRADLTNILIKVYECDPKVIGLDVFLGENKDIKNETNDTLIDVIRKVQDRLVVPCIYSTNKNRMIETVYPFFCSDSLKKITYSSPISQNVFDPYVLLDSSLISNRDLNSDVLPRMSYVVASRFGRLRNTNEKFYINYIRKNLEQWTISDSSKISIDKIKGKIVLIGNRLDIKDQEKLPFYFGNSSSSISGVDNIAYSVISLINHDDSFLKNHDAKRFKAFKELNRIWNFILTITAVVIYGILRNSLNNKKKRYKESNASKVKLGFMVLASPFIFIGFESTLVLFGFMLTSYFFIIPKLLAAMASIAFLSTSLELYDIVFPKIIKK